MAGSAVVDDPHYTTPLYHKAEAAHIIAVPAQTFRDWAVGYARKRLDGSQVVSAPIVTTLEPSRPQGVSVPFVGLAEAYIVAAFTKAGVPMRRIRPAVLWLQEHIEHFRPDPASPPFDPFAAIASPQMAWAFAMFRWIAGAVIVVPVMEELFWRDFLWRQVLAPSNFKLAAVGERSLPALLVVSIAFSTVHGNWWPTAIVWALMIGGLLMATHSLGACIVAHAVTNLLLGSYVLVTKDWGFW